MIGNIETNTSLFYENVLHYFGKISQKDSSEIFSTIERIIRENGAEKAGNTLTVSNSASEENGMQVIEVDLFVPLNKPIKMPNGFELIENFSVKNALKLRVIGSPAQFETAVKKMSEYVTENNFTPTTPLLIETVKECTGLLDVENMITDIYIGIE